MKQIQLRSMVLLACLISGSVLGSVQATNTTSAAQIRLGDIFAGTSPTAENTITIGNGAWTLANKDIAVGGEAAVRGEDLYAESMERPDFPIVRPTPMDKLPNELKDVELRPAVGIGGKAKSTGAGAVAVGSRATAHRSMATAVGAGSVAGFHSVALGFGAVNRPINYGTSNELHYYLPQDPVCDATAIGAQAATLGESGVAVGAFAKSASFGAALGTHSEVTVDEGVAIGFGSVASRDNGWKAQTVGYHPGLEAQSASVEEALRDLGLQEAYTQALETEQQAKQAYDGLPADASKEERKKANDAYTAAMNARKQLTAAHIAGAAEFSVGNAETGMTRNVTNVAAAVKDTDAVNLWQLKQVGGYFYSGGSQSGAGTALNTEPIGQFHLSVGDGLHIENVKGGKDNGHSYMLLTLDQDLLKKIEGFHTELKAGLAKTSALAALNPLPYAPNEKLQIMAGVGYYRGSTGTALGAAFTPNENLRFQAGVAFGDNDPAMNMGVSWRIGHGEAVETNGKWKQPQVTLLEKRVSTLEAEVATLKEQNEELRSLVQQMLGRK